MHLRTVQSFGRATISVLLLATGGCATGPLAPEAVNQAVKSQVVPPDQSGLYVFHPGWLYGGVNGYAILNEVIVDGESKTYVGYANYAFKLVKPGKHSIAARCVCGNPSERTSLAEPGKKYSEITLLAEPGKKHFVHVWLSYPVGPEYSGVSFTVVTPEEGAVMLKDLSLVRWLQ